MKLNEILTDHQEIVNALAMFGITNGNFGNDEFTIEPNGVVNISDAGFGQVFGVPEPLTELPVQFGKCAGAFDIDKMGLTTLKGCPKTVGKYFSCIGNELTSFEYAPSEIGGAVYASYNNITSLVGIADIFKKVGGQFSFDADKIKEGGLGLLLIEGITRLSTHGPYTVPLSKPFQIINSYLGHPELIYDCQAELIDAGFDEYTKL